MKRCAEFCRRKDWPLVSGDTWGVYTLLRRRPRKRYDVVYVGMGHIRRRLRSHSRSKRKGKLWTHFSIFEVWPNIEKEEVEELEGLLRHIYRKDTRVNILNLQRGFKKLRKIRVDNLSEWKSN